MLAPVPSADDDRFLTAIREAPDDDGVRLVYADFLQERGVAWGELIAVQCELARRRKEGDFVSDRSAVLLRRESALLATVTSWWPYPELEVLSFARGFPADVRLGGDLALTRSLPPFTNVRVDDPASLAGVVTQGVTLEARSAEAITGALEIVLRSAAFAGLRGLAVHHPAVTMAGLSESGLRLRTLDLDFTRARVERPRNALAELESLSLRETGLTPDGVTELCASTSLRSLCIARTWLGNRAGVYLAALGGLERLDVSASGIERAAILSLAERLRSLRALDISETAVNDADVVTILHSTAHLKEWGLANTAIGPNVLAMMAAGPNEITRLAISQTRMGERGAEIVASAPAFSALTHLELARTGLTLGAARRLAASTTLPPTLRLVVSEAEVGPELPALRDRFAIVIAV